MPQKYDVMAGSDHTSVNTRSSTQQLEVDDNLPKTTSEYADQLTVYTKSLSSGAGERYLGQIENGRRYHKFREGCYLLPNDEKENERLDIHHALVTCAVMDNKLFLSPIENPKHAIDLCTGTGIWAIQFADIFPDCEVIGNDLSPTQPSLVPPNLQFIIDDVESDWVYEETPFDFIHARYLAEAIRDMPRLLQQAYNCLKPGGWIEFQDWDTHPYSIDGSIKGTGIEQFYDVVLNAFIKQGFYTHPGRDLENWFIDAGFVNVHVKKYRVPLGSWAKGEKNKQAGAYNLMQYEEAIEGGALAVLTRYENWTPEEVQVLVAKARADARRPDVHVLFDFYVVWGQKPEK
ncbi:hypothetical protein AJ79_00734 [Helicocarpus griseus UAMH5409]|uniref:Methyltransferase domain-containing protein n=1 Tax=Helicocarpus griseus UAMH5409 TaxID=1447875 RepID=A0A2B7Y9C0_9EURO|nr:hypothetical protein AJ79_00734 [Helicocarpus griseus UAMH5409]